MFPPLIIEMFKTIDGELDNNKTPLLAKNTKNMSNFERGIIIKIKNGLATFGKLMPTLPQLTDEVPGEHLSDIHSYCKGEIDEIVCIKTSLARMALLDNRQLEKFGATHEKLTEFAKTLDRAEDKLISHITVAGKKNRSRILSKSISMFNASSSMKGSSEETSETSRKRSKSASDLNAGSVVVKPNVF